MSIFNWQRKTKKQRRREQIEVNRRRGKAAEEAVMFNYALRGYEVERTGKGSDFRARKRELLTGKVIESKLVEVKTPNAPLSKLQQRTKKRKRLKVERYEPFMY